MTCLTLATGVVTGISTTGSPLPGRAPAMTNPMPLTNSATLTTKSQWTVRMGLV
jgi:hypothetical protein